MDTTPIDIVPAQTKDKVFIEIEDSFWYYYADMSNYFE